MVLFRQTGIRKLAAMNTFDYIVIFLLSNVVQIAVSGNDTCVLGGMVVPRHSSRVNRLTANSPTGKTLLRGRATTVAAHRFQNCAASACGEASSNTRCGYQTAMTSAKSTTAGSNPAGNCS
jgi:hypothetical protein